MLKRVAGGTWKIFKPKRITTEVRRVGGVLGAVVVRVEVKTDNDKTR